MKYILIIFGLLFLFIEVFTSISGYNNRNTYLDSVGAGEFAGDFSRYCHRHMNRYKMRFRYSTPTPQYGCICVGVRMENRYPAEVKSGLGKARDAFAAYMEHLRHKEMNRSMRGLAWQTEIAGGMKAAIRNSFHYCDNYSLDGTKRVDLSRYPKHLRKVDDKYYLLARQR